MATAMSHTPGPWFVLREGRGRLMVRTYAPIVPDLEAVICQVMAGAVGDAQSIANARLIVAAPELLASLTELVNSPNVKQNAAWDRARATIASATIASAEGKS